MPTQTPRVQFNFEPEPPIESNEVFSEDEADEPIEDTESEEEIIEPVKVIKVQPTDDIFEDMPSQILSDLESKITKAKPTKKTKKPSDPNKPKRKVDPEHMKKMQAAAAATRARKKKEKEENQALDTETKALTNRKKKMELEKMRKEMDGEPAQPIRPKSPTPPDEPLVRQTRTTFTQEDLSKIQFDAIERYEALRKNRKAIKRAAQQKEKEQEDLMRTIKGTNKQPHRRSIYDQCY